MAYKFFTDVTLQRNALVQTAIDVITDSTNADASAVESQIVFFDNTTPAASASGNDWGYGKAPYIKYPAGWKAFITSVMVDTNAAATADLIPIRDGNGDIYVPTTPTGANSAASKSYVDSQISSVVAGISIRGDITATFIGDATITFPVATATSYTASGTNYSGAAQSGDATAANIESGNAWYFNTVTDFEITLGSNTITQGDLIIAIVDSPASASDWLILENSNDLASETTAGIIELATQVEVDAGTDTERAVTPATLQTKLDDKNFGRVFTQAVTTLSGETTAITIGSGYAVTDVVMYQLYDTSSNLEPIAVDISNVAINGSDLEITWSASPSITTSAQFGVIVKDN